MIHIIQLVIVFCSSFFLTSKYAKHSIDWIKETADSDELSSAMIFLVLYTVLFYLISCIVSNLHQRFFDKSRSVKDENKKLTDENKELLNEINTLKERLAEKNGKITETHAKIYYKFNSILAEIKGVRNNKNILIVNAIEDCMLTMSEMKDSYTLDLKSIFQNNSSHNIDDYNS